MTELETATRLLTATALGAAIGIEREMRQKPAGLRTNMLIAFGACMFTMISIVLAGPNGIPDRLAGQIVVGIGFLGGGAILRSDSGKTVHGMTTAATIWVNAALGMACGAGAFAMAMTGTAITLAILVVLPPIEAFAEKQAGMRNKHELDR
jgi:putative Mg2+ transporter-C (MgtC) family protein